MTSKKKVKVTLVKSVEFSDGRVAGVYKQNKGDLKESKSFNDNSSKTKKGVK